MELITRAQAAELLTVSEDTIDRLVKAGQLPAYKISPKITRFDRADVEEYLASRYVKAKELQRKDNPDFFKNLFARLGWFKIRDISKDGLGARDLKDVPREYRDLVRRYFLKLSEENPISECR